MTAFHVAHLNVARLRAPLEAPEMAGFVAELDPVNAVADAAPGFVWRLMDDTGNATNLRPWGEEILVNMSVWETIEALQAYTYASGHLDVLRRRREWFLPMDTANTVMWWVPVGHEPLMVEAQDRLALLDAQGPTARAFTFRSVFPAPDEAGDASPGLPAADPAG